MTKPRLLVLVAVVLPVVALAAAAPALRAEEVPATAAQWYARGEALLAQGLVDEAAQAFLTAARAEPRNQGYVDRAMVLRRVQGLRRFVASDDASERWANAAVSLHLFYLQSALPALAVDVDRRAHARLGTADTAALLAEAYLANGQNAEATNLLAEYSGSSPRHAVYHAIALARMGMLEEAGRVAEGAAVVNQEVPPAESYDRARMWTLLGRQESALLLLRDAFERTPSPALPSWKQRAQAEPDLAALRALPAWADLMTTASKVRQTCSGGSSCATCPNRGKCGGG